MHGKKAHGTVVLALPLQGHPPADVKHVRRRTAVPNAPQVSVQLSRGPHSDQMPPVGQHFDGADAGDILAAGVVLAVGTVFDGTQVPVLVGAGWNVSRIPSSYL